ncbi:MAG TPA: ATP-binding protein [Draconibacterium sp.]|nr:ATP-binding protein [Draconibacterium sp.]
MRTKIIFLYRYLRNQEILLLAIIGLLFGYFILHPISMVIYWYEMTSSVFNFSSFGEVLSESFSHSFSLHMMPMSVAYSILGVLVGVTFGLYYKTHKNNENILRAKGQLLNQNINTLITNGETEFVEFKSSLRYDYRQVKTDKNLEHIILKSIAGFLNGKGGTLIIGVDDYGEILGLENDFWTLKKKNRDGFQQRIIMLVSNEFGKDICPRLHIEFHIIERLEICSILIEPSSRPVYFNQGNRTIFYLRTGNVTNQLTTSETVKYLQSKS